MTTLKIAFPDTNMFLHYCSAEQINLPRQLKCDRVTLVITQVVIRQLNEKKDSPGNPKLRQRAGSALKRMYSYNEQVPPVSLRNAVDIQFQRTEPQIDFRAEKLSEAISDDWLLASILEFERKPHEGEVVLITADLGLTIKARNLGIDTYKLPEEYELPEDEDPKEKRIRELEEENRQLQFRIPRLKLGFNDGTNLFRAKLRRSPNPYFSREAIESRTQEIRGRYPKIDVRHESMKQRFSATPIPEHDFQLYNFGIEEFWGDFQNFLEKSGERLDWLQRLVKLELQLFNDGTCPATDINVFINFPDRIDVYEDGRLPGPPEKPSPPLPPGSLDSTNHTINWKVVSAFPKELEEQLITKQREAQRTIYSNVSPLTIIKSKDYEVRAKVQELKHHLREPICELYISFSAWDAIKPFEVAYSLFASNIPHRLEGTLNVIAEVETDKLPA